MVPVLSRFTEILPIAALWRVAAIQYAFAWGFTLRLIHLLLPSLAPNTRKSECDNKDHILPPPNVITDNPSTPRLLMIGNSSETWRIGETVRKVYHTDADIAITKANIEAAKNEADVYLILNKHHLIAKYLSICPAKSYIDLEFYPKGTLRDYLQSNRSNISDSQLKTWARLLVESVAYIHSKGVRHADLRLDQWLLDEDLQPRLADFNGSGFDDQPDLGLNFTPATSIEGASHCLPRDFNNDSTVKSDLFALGSSLYELMTDSQPFEGKEDDVIESNFSRHIFPSVDHLLIGNVILGCWKGRYTSAEQILDCLGGASSSCA